MRILLLAATTLFAQDADLVLRTAVAFNTRLASGSLEESVKAEATKLGQQAQMAAVAGNFKVAMRDYTHGFTLMRGLTWTPSVELASAINAQVDDAIANPGQQLQLTLEAIFPTDHEAVSGLTLTLQPSPRGDAIPLEAPKEFKNTELPLKINVKLPPTAAGNYQLVATLGDFADGGQRVQKAVPIRIAPLEADATKLATRIKKQPLPAAEYALVLYDRAEHGKANPQQIDFAKLFGDANQLLDIAATGKDPFAGRTGDIHQAYRSAADNTLQPYRVYVPAAYQGKPLPLVIALHGMGGDETSMMDGYGGVFKREAERLGYFLVTPKGREPASMYRGTAEKDVLDVLAEVQRTYKIDSNRIYLMGHSMGGYGTWSIAMNHPELFAALGPIAGGGNPANMVKVKDIPQIVIHGDDDRTVRVTQSRNMVEAGKKAGANIEYIEVKGGNHVDIAVPNVPVIFDFFSKQSRAAAVAK